MRTRTPKDVIDQAVAENRSGERLLYFLAAAFAIVGLFVVVWSAVNKLGLAALAGSISSSLCIPAMNSARRTRKESVAIRLLEVPLTRTDTAQEASQMLQGVFAMLMKENIPSESRKAAAVSVQPEL